jgi:hypothetical protein
VLLTVVCEAEAKNITREKEEVEVTSGNLSPTLLTQCSALNPCITHANHTQPETPFDFSNLAQNGSTLALVINKMKLRSCRQLRFTLRLSQTRAAQINSMMLTECRVRSWRENLDSTNHYRVAAMLAAKVNRLRVEVFSFVGGGRNSADR